MGKNNNSSCMFSEKDLVSLNERMFKVLIEFETRNKILKEQTKILQKKVENTKKNLRLLL